MNINIKKERRKSGLRQDQLAKLIGVSKQTVCNWECEKTRPSAVHETKIISALGIKHLHEDNGFKKEIAEIMIKLEINALTTNSIIDTLKKYL